MSYGRSGVMQRVIHIGSSVPACSVALLSNPTVLYFGQIRPKKGLESFRRVGPPQSATYTTLQVPVIGSVPRGVQLITSTCAHTQCRKSNG